MMSNWTPTPKYDLQPVERVLVCLQYPDWPAPEVRSAQYFPVPTPRFHVDGYGIQPVEYVRYVMPMPEPLVEL